VQRSESRRSEKQSICAQSTDMYNMVHRSSSVDRAVDRLQEPASVKGQPTDWHEPSFC